LFKCLFFFLVFFELTFVFIEGMLFFDLFSFRFLKLLTLLFEQGVL
jgi:hypothetical protein